MDKSYDFVIGRAVTALPTFFSWVHKQIAKGGKHSPANGILYLKGGDYTEELESSRLHPAKIWNLDELRGVPTFAYIAEYNAV